MRVCLLTDTLGDVNGVSRFVRAMAEEAAATGRDLHAASSTRFEVPARPNLVNFRPRLARPMPGYANLEIVPPPARRLRRWLRERRPDAVHISTPGPVGLTGRWVARRLGIPLLGTYHTDFPAYVAQLLGDPALSRATAGYMRWFYRPFARVLTRSAAYIPAVRALGIPAERITPLRPGIDVEAFHPRHRDESIWARLGVPPGVKVLYVGRVSIEKNLPLLARAWASLRPADATLVVVGDGPYRAAMERDLAGARFLGFRHGPELSAIYASADLFAFPSATDTLGQSVMEAQASGLPAIVSDVGGPSEIVRHGATGLIAPAHAPNAWAAAIRSLLTDTPARLRMAAAAGQHLRDASIARSFEHFWALHEEAVRDPRG
jgi:glycosyltransferase involved in cell wall biosynthesis